MRNNNQKGFVLEVKYNIMIKHLIIRLLRTYKYRLCKLSDEIFLSRISENIYIYS